MKKIYLIAVLFLAACGTIFSGSTQDVSFDSNISGVKIYADGLEICKTPCVFPLERKSSTTIITAKKKGFSDKQIILRSHLNKIAILNLTFWPSWLTDVATGGMWQYRRDAVYVDMEKENPTHADLNNVAIRRFALFGYDELKLEASAKNVSGDYILSLSELCQKNHLIY